MSKNLPIEFGQRPKGHGVTPQQWQKWKKRFDDLQANVNFGGVQIPMPKNPVVKEIFLAGAWVEFQLEQAGATPDDIQSASEDIGTSAFLFVQIGDEFHFAPQNLWKEAMRLARIEKSPK